MSSTPSNNSQSNLKSGTVYKKIGDFLGNNPTLDAEPQPIKSNNTITNPCTNKKKRHYIDMIGDALYPSLSNTTLGKLYNKLRKLENELDISISKRHNYISNKSQQITNTQLTHSNHNITRILRLELFNTFHINPSNQSLNKWIFKFQTKLLNPNNISQSINNTMEYYYNHPLQSIISQIKFKLDKNSLSNNTKPSKITWNNPNWSIENETETKNEIDNYFDGIEIERYGNKNCIVDIYIYLCNWFIPFNGKTNKKSKSLGVLHDNHNAICKLSKPLSLLLGLGLLSYSSGGSKGHMRYHTKSEILQCLGVYIRKYKLLRNDYSMAIDCNKTLEELIGVKTVYCANLWKMLVMKKHIMAPEPIHIKHKICVSGSIQENAKIYDILVKIPSMVGMKACMLMEEGRIGLFDVKNNDNISLTIDGLGVQISDVLEEINDQTKEKNIYDEYGKDPVSAIEVIVDNQRENLQIIKEFCENGGVKSSEYFANSSVYGDIKRYLKKRQIEKKENEGE